jgi:large repetitive protein
VLVYDRALSDAERASVDAYLHAKYLQAGPPNELPVVAISQPLEGSAFAVGATVDLTATATDAEDGDLSSAITWSSNLDGPLGSGGSLVGLTGLSEGSHVITAAVTDTAGQNATSLVTIKVGNAAPVVVITAPAAGTTVLEGAELVFTATATDAEDGDLGAAVAWSSDLDGALGSGATLATTGLSIGNHVITATVVDNAVPARSGSATLAVTITDPLAQPLAVTAGLVMRLESGPGVVAPGGVIASWADQSGLGNDLVASGNPQLVAAATPSGQAALVFDGADDKLERTSNLGGLPVGNGERTMFVVAKYLGSSAWAGVSYGQGSDNGTFGLAVKQTTGELMLQGWGGGHDLVSATPGIGAGWLVQSGKVGGGSGTLYRDGAQIGQFSHAYNTGLTKFVIGEEIAGLGHVAMEVAAVLVYDRALSDAERASVDAYLHAKYLQAATITHTDPMPPGYLAWINSFDLNSAPSVDSDGGGSDNLTEFYLGLDPTDSGDDFKLRIEVLPGGTHVKIHYPLLQPVGNFSLLISDTLDGAEGASDVVEVISRVQLEGMTETERRGLSAEIEINRPRAFFRLKFVPAP